ncbi:MAG: hypothetical protein ACRCZI_02085 [Cetobacterium sp.]
MTEDSELNMGLYIIVVLCLIVIAMSSYKVAYCGDSYFSDIYKASLPYAGERSDRFSGANEQPSFFNFGSVEETNAALQEAAKQSEGYTPAPKKEHYQARPNFEVPTDFTHIESFAGTGV